MSPSSTAPKRRRHALDNTVVVTANGHGRRRQPLHRRIPFRAEFGSCGGFFKTGQFVKYSRRRTTGWLVSLLNAMDVQVDTFGAQATAARSPSCTRKKVRRRGGSRVARARRHRERSLRVCRAAATVRAS